MDQMKNAASDQMGNIDEMLKGLKFPASKDEVVNQLQQRGVPSQVLDKVRSASTDRFTNPQELKSMIPDIGH